MAGNATLIWLLLDDLADEQSQVAVSLSDIQRRVGVSHKTVISGLRRLIAEGSIEKLPPDRAYLPSRYRLIDRPTLLTRAA